MKRLVNTSVGWIEIAFADGMRLATLLRLDGSGWVVSESGWGEYGDDLATGIEGLGVPVEEAQEIAEQLEGEWLRRGGAPQPPSPWWEGPALAAVLLATVGVWIAGVWVLIGLLVRLIG
jgi:hypothetical protein